MRVSMNGTFPRAPRNEKVLQVGDLEVLHVAIEFAIIVYFRTRGTSDYMADVASMCHRAQKIVKK